VVTLIRSEYKENMKAILEFDLNDIDDVYAHKRCVKSLDMSLCLLKIKDILTAELPDDYPKEAGKLRNEVLDAFDRYGILLDEIIY
jgi:hypothetical protein